MSAELSVLNVSQLSIESYKQGHHQVIGKIIIKLADIDGHTHRIALLMSDGTDPQELLNNSIKKV